MERPSDLQSLQGEGFDLEYYVDWDKLIKEHGDDPEYPDLTTGYGKLQYLSYELESSLFTEYNHIRYDLKITDKRSIEVRKLLARFASISGTFYRLFFAIWRSDEYDDYMDSTLRDFNSSRDILNKCIQESFK